MVNIVEHLNDAVDVVVTGHSHQAYVCTINDKLVTSAGSFGHLITDIDLIIDQSSGEVVKASAHNVVVTGDVPKSSALSELVARYAAIAEPLEQRTIGTVTADIIRHQTPAGELALGDLVADAQLAATDGPDEGAAVVAFMNPGSIRGGFLHAPSGGEPPGLVTYGEAFATQPFGTTLVTMTLTGSQLDTLLEQQWCGQVSPQILQVSTGFRYTWDADRSPCDRVDPTTIKIDGVLVDPVQTYRVTVNSFLAQGGDQFTVLTEGTDRLDGPLDLDALVAYFEANSPVTPGARDRISRKG
jgi:5'-nucleotidase